jgi:hypothetical protein
MARIKFRMVEFRNITEWKYFGWKIKKSKILSILDFGIWILDFIM